MGIEKNHILRWAKGGKKKTVSWEKRRKTIPLRSRCWWSKGTMKTNVRKKKLDCGGGEEKSS